MGRRAKQMHGLSRTLGQNMITGVAEGWSKQLKLVGVGYRAEANPKAITLSLGYSHPVVMEIPEGLKVEVAKGNTDITVSGIDKEQVGNFAANMRKKRPPEPYKGKGVRYADEYVPLKAGNPGGSDFHPCPASCPCVSVSCIHNIIEVDFWPTPSRTPGADPRGCRSSAAGGGWGYHPYLAVVSLLLLVWVPRPSSASISANCAFRYSVPIWCRRRASPVPLSRTLLRRFCMCSFPRASAAADLESTRPSPMRSACRTSTNSGGSSRAHLPRRRRSCSSRTASMTTSSTPGGPTPRPSAAPPAAPSEAGAPAPAEAA